MAYVIVGVSGMIGALLRYFLGSVITHFWIQDFPLSTLIINLIGCFVLGGFTTHLARLEILHPKLITGIGTGLIGSFTTFSTFSTETADLLQRNHWGAALLYLLLSLWGGLFFSWLGYKAGGVVFNLTRPDHANVDNKGETL